MIIERKGNPSGPSPVKFQLDGPLRPPSASAEAGTEALPTVRGQGLGLPSTPFQNNHSRHFFAGEPLEEQIPLLAGTSSFHHSYLAISKFLCIENVIKKIKHTIEWVIFSPETLFLERVLQKSPLTGGWVSIKMSTMSVV